MRKYKYYESDGVQAVIRDTENLKIEIHQATPTELTREAFKEIKDDPTKFNKKKHEVKDVDKNE